MMHLTYLINFEGKQSNGCSFLFLFFCFFYYDDDDDDYNNIIIIIFRSIFTAFK